MASSLSARPVRSIAMWLPAALDLVAPVWNRKPHSLAIPDGFSDRPARRALRSVADPDARPVPAIARANLPPLVAIIPVIVGVIIVARVKAEPEPKVATAEVAVTVATIAPVAAVATITPVAPVAHGEIA